jgi:hypothetical protein
MKIDFVGDVYAAGNIYYVAKTGNDSDPGTFTKPWLTINHAATHIAAGDTVYIEGGTYNEQVFIHALNGSPSSYTTFQNYNGQTVIIDGTNVTMAGSGLVNIDRSTYLTLNGLQVQNSSDMGIAATYGVLDHLNFLNLNVHDCGSDGIEVGYNGIYTTTNILISGCYVHNVCTLGQYIAGACVQLDSPNGFEVKNNIFYKDNGAVGMSVMMGGSNGTIHNNEFNDLFLYIDAEGVGESNINVYGNYFHDCTTTTAIDVGDEKAAASMTNLNFYNNQFYNNPYGCFVVGGVVGVGLQTVTFSFVNNTCYENAGFTRADIIFGDATSNWSNCVIADNIIVTTGSNNAPIFNKSPSNGNTTIDHNLFYCANGSLLTANQNVVYGTNPVYANPLLKNPPIDFSLQLNSPAIDAANALYAQSTDYIGTTRPQGAGYDIGAYEYMSSATTTTPPPTTTTPPQMVTINAIMVTSPASLPTASAAYRGVIAIVQGGNGIKDALYQCMKSATNTYSWVSIATGG